METRAPYALIGAFVLAVIAAVFGFVYWLNNAGGLGQRTVYHVRFENSVSGLLTGAAVLFNGIRVGEVTELRLLPDDPRQVIATIAVVPSTPVRADTQAGLEFQGLTGVPVIALQGGSASAPAPQGAFVLVADPTSGQSMTQAARQALQRVDTVLAENATPLRETIGNINTFAGALARNSEKVDGIIAGLERMTGAAPPLAPPPAYDLVAPKGLAALAKPLRGQLAVREPTAPILYDSQRILSRDKGGAITPLSGGQWSDNLTKLLQARLVQSFENANLAGAVDRQADDLKAEFRLTIDIRSFQLVTAGAPVADVELSAKILGEDGKILAAKIFRATVPAEGIDAPAAATALNEGFRQIAVDLVTWATGVI
jgi:phospholipid/cholesterol/gamma-HCH transport system substrate-binding protein